MRRFQILAAFFVLGLSGCDPEAPPMEEPEPLHVTETNAWRQTRCIEWSELMLDECWVLTQECWERAEDDWDRYWCFEDQKECFQGVEPPRLFFGDEELEERLRSASISDAFAQDSRVTRHATWEGPTCEESFPQ